MPFHDWRKIQSEGFRTRDAHLLQEFDRDPDIESVLVIDRPVSRLERVLRRVEPTVDGDVVGEFRAKGRRAKLTRVGQHTTVLDIVDPSWLVPATQGRGWWFDVFDSPATIECVRWAIEETKAANAPWISWHPAMAGLARALRPERLVFDSLDNWLIHPVLSREADRARAAYAELLPTAATFVSAPASAAALAAWAAQPTILPNGVDPTIFMGPFERPADLPPPPVVGYAGKLAHRIDSGLVAATATALPTVTFAFLGPVLDQKSVRPLLQQANIRLMGDRPYDALPAYLRAIDLAWIPHRVGKGESGGDPIKLYEYWAAGRQVVSTPIDGMDANADQVHIVRTANDASDVIGGLLAGTTAPKPTTVPPERTWRAIASRLLEAAA
jgi:glycosyltransferase involved in cell wall biosynthesis